MIRFSKDKTSKGFKVDTSKIVAVVVTDRFGSFVNFNEDGGIDNAGNPVYQKLYQIKKNKDGSYITTDRYGREQLTKSTSKEVGYLYDLTKEALKSEQG